MNDKRIVETFKIAKLDAKLSEPPRLPTSEEIADLKAMALGVLAAALKRKSDTPRSIRQVDSKPKSEARQELENHIQRIVDRWDGHLPNLRMTYPGPGPACYAASAKVEPEIELHDLLRDLKKKLKLA